MRKILLVAAIYSLIVNQCCKKGQKSLYNQEQKEKITGMGVILGKLYYLYIAPASWPYKNTGLFINGNAATYVNGSERGQP
jgi:hypothetical protein